MNFGIEAKLIGNVLKSQETLKLIDKTMAREGTIDFGPGKSGRDKMKEGRIVREKNVLTRN